MTNWQSHDSISHKLTSEQKEYAAEILNESDENRERAIAEIRRWIQENDLRARTDDFFILRFLRACKFNIENTKSKMQNYQTQRAKITEWFANRDPLQPKLQELLDLGICLPLRKLDSQGRLVCISRFAYDPNIFTISEFVKVSCMIGDVALRDSVEASVYGTIIILDMEHVTLSHVAQMTPSFILKAVNALQSSYPIRLNSFIFINTPEYTKYVLSVVRFFLSDKLKERFHVYSRNSDCCLKNVAANILPVEYGGTDATIQELTEYWKKVIEENREWFIDDEQYKPILK